MNGKSTLPVGLGLGLVARYYRRQWEKRLVTCVAALWGALYGPETS